MSLFRLLLVLPCLLAGTTRAAELTVGDAVPDCQFTNAQGQTVHVRDFNGRALALTFLFTRCPLPDLCPRMTARFSDAQRILAKDPTASKNWHLLSLSFDPQYDTPERLRAYAVAHKADKDCWTLGTAEPGVISGFGALFGLTVAEKDGLISHNLRTVIIDKDGRVQCIFRGNDWTSDELVWELRKAMR